ncbi:MAG TPA: efflux RND transporter periplasmic adaptor subunit [Candidatus Thiothrix moscowensis]|uniref:efflux RND transporter periplasmic adaptor subunit n=1 Tax=unclassified Thiothrix TaxID=2636184 RepID=UPI0025CF747C|nr:MULTISPECIES: efflux RND transporter periplasmic adaptor subunit [unclassified Thiothrix]HRJ54406.1 efflux RND transporter periplasmic adaptor subunit [Candidatus Thiothrix moscowensis]HRJ94730.1 efflux RND transporter periplasmic adaptor subunit [Candidatus Thiothrix moscowensis]
MKKVILPLLVIAVGFGLGKFLIATGPEAEKHPQETRPTVVEAQPLNLQSYQVKVSASGIVKAQTQTSLVAEVSGKVLEISPNFQAGNYFDKGETLLKLDAANYSNAVTIAEGDLAQKQLSLQEQQAQAKLAQRDWNLLDGNASRPQSDLAARRPHIAAAQAAINAAEAKLQQEKLNLARTRITAPYSGRVQEKRVEVGQYVTPGTVLGVIYATDAVEVHLPLSLAQYDLLGMPEAFRDKAADTAAMPKVAFSPSNGNRNDVWQGQVVRSSAALDEKSRQISVIAQIDQPFSARDGVSTPLRIGQYVTAKIDGKTFNNVYVVPASAVRQGKEILLLRDGKVSVQSINLVWNAEKDVVFQTDADLNGQRVIITPLPLATEGQAVQVAGETKPESKP